MLLNPMRCLRGLTFESGPPASKDSVSTLAFINKSFWLTSDAYGSRRERSDLWARIIEKSKGPGALTLGEHHSNASLFMIAGTETVRISCRSQSQAITK